MKNALVLFITIAALFAAHVSRADQRENTPNMNHQIVWFEIPVLNMDRAVNFYETILSIKLKVERKPEFSMAFFPGEHEDGRVTGALVQMNEYQPSAAGTLVYLNGGEDLINVQNKIETAGGKILIPKTLISPEIGYFAQFLDTEGNRLALFFG